MAQIIDITVPISEDLVVWPGDAAVQIEHGTPISEGATSNISRYSFGSHTGTHVDPPRHCIDDALTVDKLALDVLIGPAWVAHFPGVNSITPEDLEKAGIPNGCDRLFLKTDNSDFWPPEPNAEFRTDFAHLSLEGAEWVVERGIRLVGIDYLSIQKFKMEGHKTHLALLTKGIIIIEGADLSQVEPGEYELVCLPLRIVEGDGSPVRAVLIR